MSNLLMTFDEHRQRQARRGITGNFEDALRSYRTHYEHATHTTPTTPREELLDVVELVERLARSEDIPTSFAYFVEEILGMTVHPPFVQVADYALLILNELIRAARQREAESRQARAWRRPHQHQNPRSSHRLPPFAEPFRGGPDVFHAPPIDIGVLNRQQPNGPFFEIRRPARSHQHIEPIHEIRTPARSYHRTEAFAPRSPHFPRNRGGMFIYEERSSGRPQRRTEYIPDPPAWVDAERSHEPDYEDFLNDNPFRGPQSSQTSSFEVPVERAVTQADTTETCIICTENPKLGETLTVLPCQGHAGHWFHKECIQRWMDSSEGQNCPNRCPQRPAR